MLYQQKQAELYTQAVYIFQLNLGSGRLCCYIKSSNIKLDTELNIQLQNSLALQASNTKI